MFSIREPIHHIGKKPGHPALLIGQGVTGASGITVISPSDVPYAMKEASFIAYGTSDGEITVIPLAPVTP